MRRLKTAGLGLVSAAFGAALVLGVMALHVSAVSHTVSVGTATVAVGSEGSVSVDALNMTEPGLGAWSLNVVYDPAVVDAVDCAGSGGSVCNPDFAEDTVRISGANPTGLEGDNSIATITFRCLLVGSSSLTLNVELLADATPGDPQDIVAATEDGSITCLEPSTPALPSPTPRSPTPTVPAAAPTPTPTSAAAPAVAPSAGFGPGGPDGGSAVSWFIAALAGAGLAWLTAGLAGAGLAAVTGLGPLGRARSEPAPKAPGFVPHMRPVEPRPPSPPPRPASSETGAIPIEGFRPPPRPRLRW